MGRNLIRINQFLERYPAFTHGQIRWLVFHAAKNGLDEARVVVRLPRRVFLDEDRFFEWLEAQQKPAGQARGEG